MNDSDLYSEKEDSDGKDSVSVSESDGSESIDDNDESDKSMEDIDDDELMNFDSVKAKEEKPNQSKKKENAVPLY